MEKPRHPALHFKQIHGSDRLVAIHISPDCRAAGVPEIEILWFCIGPPSEYERLLAKR
jgi:hypothetical protein